MDALRSGSSPIMLMSFRDIENLILLKELVNNIRIYWNLLKFLALCYFEQHLNSRIPTEESELPENDPKELVICDIGLEYTLKCTISVKKE
jgi:hypothetical protein